MRAPTLRCGFIALALLLLGTPVCRAEWLKGNTHFHSERSFDSSATIREMLEWYAANGYDFVVLTDHGGVSTVDSLRSLIPHSDLLLFGGQELTTSVHHLNAIGLAAPLAPLGGLAESLRQIRDAGALPQINHPEYSHLSGQMLVEALARTGTPPLLEIYSSHPLVRRASGDSSEEIWDHVLSAGHLVWGSAADDAHTPAGGAEPPGGGCVYVDARERTRDGVLEALRAGRFYASSGARILEWKAEPGAFTVDAPGADEIVFLGRGGAVLKTVRGEMARYDYGGDELYVRARVRSRAGMAWTQPHFVSQLPANEPPVARIAADPLRGPAPLSVHFSAEDSSDPDGQVASWVWNSEHFREHRGMVFQNRFFRPGIHTVILTVYDQRGAPATATVDIEVLEPGSDQ